MRQFLADLQKNLKGIWTRLDGGQRLVVIAVMLASMIGLGGMVWYAGQPSYETVFTSTDGDDLKAAKQLLQSAGIPYVPDSSGFAVQVDHARVAAANAALAEGSMLGAGSTRGNGSSALTPFADRETRELDLRNRSIQQAESVIAGIDGVRSAKVTASASKRSPFSERDKENQATAAVLLRLKPGVKFGKVAPSAAAVASSQMMVPLENVTVLNAATNERWRHDPDRDADGTSSDFMAQQRAIADERSRLAQAALDQLYPGKTVVSVGVELDNKWELTNQKMVPTEQLLASEQTTKDTAVTAETNKNGDPSTTPASGPPAGTKNDTKKETIKKDYVTDIGERRSGSRAPAIKRMTVALLYDKSLEKKDGFKSEQLVAVVKSIVGWDSQRDEKDAFSTLADDFPPLTTEVEGSTGPGMMEHVVQWGPMIGQVLGLVLVLMFLKGLLKQPKPTAEVEAPLPAGVSEEALPPDEQQKRMRREIERAIASDPAALAKVLESWLQESKA